MRCVFTVNIITHNKNAGMNLDNSTLPIPPSIFVGIEHMHNINAMPTHKQPNSPSTFVSLHHTASIQSKRAICNELASFRLSILRGPKPYQQYSNRIDNNNILTKQIRDENSWVNYWDNSKVNTWQCMFVSLSFVCTGNKFAQNNNNIERDR